MNHIIDKFRRTKNRKFKLHRITVEEFSRIKNLGTARVMYNLDKNSIIPKVTDTKFRDTDIDKATEVMNGDVTVTIEMTFKYGTTFEYYKTRNNKHIYMNSKYPGLNDFARILDDIGRQMSEGLAKLTSLSLTSLSKRHPILPSILEDEIPMRYHPAISPEEILQTGPYNGYKLKTTVLPADYNGFGVLSALARTIHKETFMNDIRHQIDYNSIKIPDVVAKYTSYTEDPPQDSEALKTVRTFMNFVKDVKSINEY